ncbi:uncharacterized protein LOC111591634, partial [Ceratitis capitata]|uniref:uncharacterized protein LOC111591634 n=1 Tax=Ceratitis capitata TaxID=7213 RepID=UPI000C6C6EE7
MIAIDDEDDYNYHHACRVTASNASFKKISSNQSYYNGTKSSNGSSSSSKRNVTYLNFLRKTRRKGSKDSFKATTPKRNVRKRQTLRVYWQKLLPNSTKSHIYKFVSSRNAKSLQNLCVNESFVSTLKSNTCITSKQLRFEDEQHCWEMRRVCHVKQSKSKTSLTATLYESYKVSRLVANSESVKSFKFSTSCCTESESTLSAQKQYAKASKAHIKINRTFCSNKAHSSSNKRHTSDWSYNNYINKSNILEPNDSYRRTPKTIERLCTRKKRRLRRRRKRKGNTMRIEEMEEEQEDINHNTKTTKCTQQQFSTTYSSILETSNAPAVEGTTIEAMPIAVNAPTHDMLASLSAKLSSITVYRTVSLKNMPAIETLPKLSDCNAQHSNNSCTTFSSFCCSGGNASANDVKQPAKSSNSLATVATNICSASDVRTSTTISTSTSSSAIKTATATVTMSPAIRLSAFYAATTLRIFLTTLTTLIASTTPTAFTATKYSWIFLWIYVNLTARVGLAGYHEKRLLHDLLDPYNTLERPVLNESDPLQLSFGLTLMQIIDV